MCAHPQDGGAYGAYGGYGRGGSSSSGVQARTRWVGVFYELLT